MGGSHEKIILIVLLLIQFGCSKQQISPIDSNIWGYDFNENQLSGSFSAMRNVTESEEGVFFIIPIQLSEGGETNILGYINKASGDFSIVDSNVSTNCSFELPQSCSSQFSNKYNYINYYNNQLYFVESVINVNTNATTIQLSQMDLDGSNRKTVATLSESAPNVSEFSILFHKGMIYYSFGSGKVNQIDMSTWKNIEIISSPNTRGINLISAQDNSIYFTVNVYVNGDTRLLNTLLSYDTEANTIKETDINLPLYQFNDETYVYYEAEDDSMYLFNSQTKDKLKLKQNTGSVLFDRDFIVIKDYASNSPYDLYLFDLKGNLVDSFKQNKGLAFSGFIQLISNQYLYAYLYHQDRTEFVRINYQNAQFGEIESLATWPGSRYAGNKL